MADASQRTEQPTPRRLDKAREEGRFPVSREFVGAIGFLAFVWLAASHGGDWTARFRLAFRALIEYAFRPGELTVPKAIWLWREITLRELAPLVGCGLILTVVALAAQLASTRLGVAAKKLAPDFARLNPASRLSQLPSQNLAAFFQALVLVPLFGWAVWAVGRANLPAYLALPLGPVENGVRVLVSSLEDLLWKAAFVLLLIGAVDFIRQRRRWMAEMRMSRQEVRDEYKETEGNPLIKMRVRRLQRDLLRRRMIREVPKATAVIVNPTHYAVAIRYRHEDMAAPKVIAKGKNYLARRIRELAVANEIPIVENPPLAQALYKGVEVGQEIPPHLYQAVAEILAYIYRLLNGRLPG